MGERKVLNKYFPADFYPATIPRPHKPKNQQTNVRMMLPMSIRCNKCGNYIYQGTKFNCRKENVVGDNYLGVIQVFRFYFRCTSCSTELIIKTDPKNSDYAVEGGATRNFEPWRDQYKEVYKDDVMKSLERRASDSKQEMDILAGLDELKSMKSRREAVSIDAMLGAIPNNTRGDDDKERKLLDEEDEALIKSIFLGSNYSHNLSIDDNEEWDNDDEEASNKSAKRLKVSKDIHKDVIFQSPTVVQIVVKMRAGQKPVEKDPVVKEDNSQQQEGSNITNNGLKSLCQYDSEDDE